MPLNQKTYTAHFNNLTSEQIEALRGVGCIDFVFTVEAEDRNRLIRELSDEYEWQNLGNEDDWQRRLSRGKPRA